MMSPFPFPLGRNPSKNFAAPVAPRFLRLVALVPLPLLVWSCSQASSPGDEGLVDADGQSTAPAPPMPAPEATSSDAPLFGGAAPEQTVAEPSTGEDESVGQNNTAGPTASNPLVRCESAVARGEDLTIDDFDDLDRAIASVDGRAGDWYQYDDGTTGVTQSAVWEDDAERGGVLHVMGGAFDEYSGVGAGLRWTETGLEHCFYDASLYAGIEFWARGEPGMRVALQNPAVRPVDVGGQCPVDAACFDSHGLDVTLSSEWTRYRLSFDAAKQAGWGTPVGDFDPSQLFLLEFQFMPQRAYEVWLDEVTFYVDDPATPDAGAALDAGTDAALLDAGAPGLDAALLDGAVSPGESPPRDAGSGGNEPDASADARDAGSSASR